MADATTRSLDKFNDPSFWDRIDTDIPIFVEHEALDSDGKLLYRVDKKRLYEIAAEINRQYEHDGCAMKIFEGHTKPPGSVSQGEQPKILAYGVGARVGPWGPKKRLGVILKKQYIRKGCQGKVDELPERSPEFHPKSGEIRGLALIKTDPRLNMGMTIYQRPDGVVCYSRGIEAMDPTKVPPPATDDDQDANGIPDDAEPETNPEDEKKFTAYMKKLYAKCHAMQYGEGASAVAGDTNSMPSVTLPGKKKEDEIVDNARTEKPAKPAAVKPSGERAVDDIQNDVDRIAMARMDKELQEIKYERDLIECQGQVRQLATEGYLIRDAKKEVERLMKLGGAAERLERVKEIRENYQRDPTAGDFIEMEKNDYSESEPQGEAINEVVRYAEQHKLNIEIPSEWRQAVTETKKLKLMARRGM